MTDLVLWLAGIVTPSVLPPIYKQFLRFPTPILRRFWKDFLTTPIPYYLTSSVFHCYPHPSPPQLKILIGTKAMYWSRSIDLESNFSTS